MAAATVLDEIDRELFIEQVRNHPEIWNMKCEEYKDKNRRDEAWEDISRIMVEDFEKKKEDEKRDIVRKLTIKWRNIRDTYAKSEKKYGVGKPAKGRRRYIYAKQLSFLQPCAGLGASQKNQHTVDEQPHIVDQQSMEHEADESLSTGTSESSSSEDDDQPMQISTNTRTMSPTLEQRRKELGNSLLKFMNPPVMNAFPEEDRPVPKFMNNQPPAGLPDEDQSFFDSLLPYVRRFDEDQKLEFRSEVLNVLRKVKHGSAYQQILHALPLQNQYVYPPQRPTSSLQPCDVLHNSFNHLNANGMSISPQCSMSVVSTSRPSPAPSEILPFPAKKETM